MKTLRYIKFEPAAGCASRYWEEDGFRRNDALSLADLSPEQAGTVAAAMAWAAGQLPAGFADIESVMLEKTQDVVAQWSEPENEETPAQPLAYSPAFAASIVGTGALGQRSVEIQSVLGPVTDALQALWESLAQ